MLHSCVTLWDFRKSFFQTVSHQIKEFQVHSEIKSNFCCICKLTWVTLRLFATINLMQQGLFSPTWNPANLKQSLPINNVRPTSYLCLKSYHATMFECFPLSSQHHIPLNCRPEAPEAKVGPVNMKFMLHDVTTQPQQPRSVFISELCGVFFWRTIGLTRASCWKKTL